MTMVIMVASDCDEDTAGYLRRLGTTVVMTTVIMVIIVAVVVLSTPSPSLSTSITANVKREAGYKLEAAQGKDNWESDSLEETVLLWSGGVVPYVLGDSINTTQRSILLQAMDDFHSKTCIRFRERRGETDFIEIDSDSPDCSSTVGRAGGRQVLYLNAEQCMEVGTVIHELMHILGLFHEHTREDRDDYISVNMENVIPDMRLDFTIVPGRTLGVKYNYESILHYGPYAFSREPGIKRTIVPRDPTADIKDPRHRTQMALTDALYIQRLYQDECQ